MSRGRRWLVAAAVATTVLAGCSSSPEPSPTASPSSGPSAAPTATATVTPSPSPAPAVTVTVTPSPSGTPSADACVTFGTEAASASSPDWATELRGGPGDELWGVTMRVGTHECYDRWVFEFAGDADMPGWSVTPHDASTFLGDPSGEPIAPPLAGAASLEVAFAAWFDGTPVGEGAYAGPTSIVTSGAPAIEEARILGGFEGISHVGIGLDAARPYRVTWLTDPGRLVVDVYTGS